MVVLPIRHLSPSMETSPVQKVLVETTLSARECIEILEKVQWQDTGLTCELDVAAKSGRRCSLRLYSRHDSHTNSFMAFYCGELRVTEGATTIRGKFVMHPVIRAVLGAPVLIGGLLFVLGASKITHDLGDAIGLLMSGCMACAGGLWVRRHAKKAFDESAERLQEMVVPWASHTFRAASRTSIVDNG